MKENGKSVGKERGDCYKRRKKDNFGYNNTYLPPQISIYIILYNDCNNEGDDDEKLQQLNAVALGVPGPQPGGHGRRLTCHEVSEADGAERDEGVVEGVLVAPVLQLGQRQRRQEHEHDEADAEVDPGDAVEERLAVALVPLLLGGGGAGRGRGRGGQEG